VPFLFTGDSELLYVQYLDEDTSRPLRALPGGAYEMTPAGGAALPVPPGDGRWAAADGSAPGPPEPEDPPADDDSGGAEPGVPPALLTGTGTDEDGK
jgi:hypothetical protein